MKTQRLPLQSFDRFPLPRPNVESDYVEARGIIYDVWVRSTYVVLQLFVTIRPLSDLAL